MEEYLCCQDCSHIHIVKKGEYPFRCEKCDSNKLKKGIQKLPYTGEDLISGMTSSQGFIADDLAIQAAGSMVVSKVDLKTKTITVEPSRVRIINDKLYEAFPAPWNAGPCKRIYQDAEGNLVEEDVK